MRLVSEFRALVKAVRGQLEGADYVGPTLRRSRIPRDIPLQLQFPSQIASPTEKVVYSLWHEGEQCYCNLRMLTGLSESELHEAIVSLLRSDQIVRITMDGPASLPGRFAELSRFRLADTNEPRAEAASGHV